ncbi:MAG: tetratricopeptide repeat protein [Ignavibacteriae bacterium]|nr:tetratricopeptide repeat protein [Ignavibacteria bacterium]MBI3364873.1 tetratricopeptide repeat protein [Ignavibacteriota bacterium]
MCGHVNSAAAISCESCGAALANALQSRSQELRKASTPSRSIPSAPLQFFQSWKLTVILALVLIAVLVFLRTTRDTNPHTVAGLSPTEQQLIQEIEALRKHVDANPQDSIATLRLANLLHDRGFIDQAIIMYERYLEMNPSNADARVDLGTSYFKMSFADTTRSAEYLETAKQEMMKALSYSPRHQLAFFNLGIINFHTGDVKEAREWFQKCIAVDPNSESGKKAQQFLNQHSINNPS